MAIILKNKEIMLKKIGIIGVGNMGSALAKGWIDSKMVDRSNLVLFDVDKDKLAKFTSEVGGLEIGSIDDHRLYEVDALILAVKPQVLDSTLSEIGSFLKPETIVVSIAAGIPTHRILRGLNRDSKVIRVMPNAGAMYGEGASALCSAGPVTNDELHAVTSLFSSVGKAVVVQEKDMNAVTALSGSGPAYFFVIMEAMSDAGTLLGMERAAARALVVQTLKSAAAMAEKSHAPFSDLKDMITSPGGTTIAGLAAMEKRGIRGVIMDGVIAAKNRADELGND